MEVLLILALAVLAQSKPMLDMFPTDLIEPTETEETDVSGGFEPKLKPIDYLSMALYQLEQRVQKLEEISGNNPNHSPDGEAAEDLNEVMDEIEMEMSTASDYTKMMVEEISRLLYSLMFGLPEGEALHRYIRFLAQQEFMLQDIYRVDPEDLINGYFPEDEMMLPQMDVELDVLEGIRHRLESLRQTVYVLTEDRRSLFALLSSVSQALGKYFDEIGSGANFTDYVNDVTSFGSFNSSSGTSTTASTNSSSSESSSWSTESSTASSNNAHTESTTASTVASTSSAPEMPGMRKLGDNLSLEQLKRLEKLALELETRRLLGQLEKEVK